MHSLLEVQFGDDTLQEKKIANNFAKIPVKRLWRKAFSSHFAFFILRVRTLKDEAKIYGWVHEN